MFVCSYSKPVCPNLVCRVSVQRYPVAPVITASIFSLDIRKAAMESHITVTSKPSSQSSNAVSLPP